MLTRYKRVRARQPPERVASSRDSATYQCRRVVDTRQGKAVVLNLRKQDARPMQVQLPMRVNMSRIMVSRNEKILMSYLS